MGGPLRRRKFNRAVGWSYVVAAIGAPGLHFHDLRHTGNTFAAATGAGLRDLMARMGHDSERAAKIYQHEARGADAAITGGIDAHVQAERGHEDDGTTARPGSWSLRVTGTLMARKINYGGQTIRLQARKLVLTCEDPLERAKGIEPSWPAWKAGALPLSYARTGLASRRECLARLPGQ